MTPPVTKNPSSLADILNEIESRANAATPGPWEPDNDDSTPAIHVTGKIMGDHVAWLASQGNEQSEADAAFIASARTDLPKLVKALRRAMTEVLVNVRRIDHNSAFQREIAAILTSPENGEQKQQGLGEH